MIKKYANSTENGQHASFGELAVLTPEEMGHIDRRAAEQGPFDGYGLMCSAGAAVAAIILQRFPEAHGFDVLCGPGNNGGDGYVVTRLLAERGLDVKIFGAAAPRKGSDAARAEADCPLPAASLAGFLPQRERLVVDALFGAGLDRPVANEVADAVARVREAGAPVVAVDLPSGVSGLNGRVQGASFEAALTVTFFSKKPGHLLFPGRAFCGETVVADIGIEAGLLKDAGILLWENQPALWRNLLPRPSLNAHKYTRGHVIAFSGGASATGAARLAARAAARAGAGAVTVLSPAGALPVNATHLTSIMLHQADSARQVEDFLAARRPDSAVLGPAFGIGQRASDFALTLLRHGQTLKGLVLDADAITSFAEAPQTLFDAADGADAPALLLTPHEGEFERLFPDLAAQETISKVERARRAAARAHAVVLLKGPDTVVAAPDGRAVINTNGTPFLATAGSGDVLAGIAAGLMAQGMSAFDAACAAVWLHADAARRFGGPGLMAEDLPECLPAVLQALIT